MPAITIRDVPDDVRDELAARAAREGRSLQEHLRRELIALARRERNEDVFARIRERARLLGESDVTAEEIVEAIHDGRR